MSKKRTLPLIGEREMVLFTAAGAELYKFMHLPDEPLAQVYFPLERVIRQHGPVAVADSLHMRRYLYLSNGSEQGSAAGRPTVVGVLVVLKQVVGRHSEYLSTVFVNPAYRRRGLGNRLLAAAMADYPKLALDNRLTADGLAFFRHAREAKPDLAYA
jgi:ribosomal protein S18 acetylase RimI-like enzyme